MFLATYIYAVAEDIKNVCAFLYENSGKQKSKRLV